MTAVIAIASGTAKVGKTVLSTNLAHYLSEKGNRTALLVAGSSTPVFEVHPDRTWPNILNGRIPIDQVIQSNVYGIDMVVTEGHGHALGSLSAQAAARLTGSVRSSQEYAYLVVDMAAGLTPPSVACCLAATESLLVITPDTPTLTAAYEWLSRLSRYGFRGPVSMILNQVGKPALAQSVFIRFRDLAQKKLNVQVNLWGSLSFDETTGQPDTLDRPFSVSQPHSKLLKEIQTIGDRLLAEQPPENQTQPLSMFWQTFIQKLHDLPVMPVTPHVRQTPTTKKVGPNAAPRKEAPDAGGPEQVPANVSNALLLVTDRLSTIAAELGAIRRLMENGTHRNNVVGPDQAATSENQTVLDFEAFVMQLEKAR